MSTKDAIIYYFFIAIVTIIIGVVIINTISSYQDCIDAGGTYVRGLFWFECIK